jgi:hypothetical protein
MTAGDSDGHKASERDIQRLTLTWHRMSEFLTGVEHISRMNRELRPESWRKESEWFAEDISTQIPKG